ncbi:MAG: efflux RND transporter permease subunit [Myxococcota bacterium]|nr:efflux RND transporter permease subunit [Myxococcota bacterium]
MSIAAFSVRQTVLVNVLFFVCLLGGIAAYSRIPVEFFQDINLNEANVITVWTGASGEEVERLVTQKLEEELIGISEIDEIHSVSSAGLSDIGIEFDEYLSEVEYEAALNDVRAAIDRVNDLPADAEEPEIREGKFSEFAPAVMIALLDRGDVGPVALREIARDVKARVRDLPGAKRIEIRGDQDPELRVLVDREAAARHGLTAIEIAERIRRQNLNLPAGTFEDGNGELTLRAQGDFERPEQLLDTVVAESENGLTVRLSEVARIEFGLEKTRFRTRLDGNPALLVTITKKPDADIRSLAAEVDEWIAGYRDRLPAGVEMRKTFDTSAFVSSRMGVLVENLVAGIVCVVAILWFTIGFRNATLTVIAIPFSFLTAMIFFPLFGITLNATTIVGMLLVSGMLVDDAIIVLENIFAHVERGEPLREAVLRGTEEVMWPVVAAVTTTCAAFLPLLLVGGTAGKFMSILPKAVLVCLIASLFECLVILPAHYLDFGSRKRKEDDDRPPGLFARIRARVDDGLARIRSAYARALDVVLGHRGAFSALFAACFLLTCTGSRHLDVNLFPGEFDTFNVLVEMPSDASIEQTDGVVRGYESILEGMRGEELLDYATTVGMSFDTNYDTLTGANYAMSVLTLAKDDDGEKVDPDQALIDMQQRVDAWLEANPVDVVDVRVQAEQDGPPVGAPVEVRLQSDDYALGKAVAGELKAYLETLPGVYDVEDNLKVGAPEVRLVVNEERAARYGLGFEQIALALRGANDGVVATSLRDPTRGEDVDIRVRLEDADRADLADLLDVELRTAQGFLVKLRDVADVEKTRGYSAYHRYDGKRTVSVLAQVREGEETSVGANEKVRAAFADLEERFPQLEVSYGGEFETTSEAFADLGRAFPVALVAIYMILAALFRSYLQPLIVVTAVPFAFAGIFLGVAVFGYEISFVLLYAAIGLTGVVVNDSLVMVDFINRARREEGLPLLEAVRQSGVRRFRPILLTTLTTVVALMPMAFGLQGASKTYGPFAASISFGLIVAMAGTLFAVPLAYTSLVRGQEAAQRFLARRRGEPDPTERDRAAA